MPLLKVSEIVEVFLVPSTKNAKAVEEIKDSMLERTNYDYKDIVAVDWDEDLGDEYNIVTVDDYHKTVSHVPVDPESIWVTHFIQIDVLMMLIFKDDLHNIAHRDGQRKVQFLAHLVRG